jgi:hypothetical protein
MAMQYGCVGQEWTVHGDLLLCLSAFGRLEDASAAGIAL